MTLSLIFQFIAKDKIYKKNSRINGVNNTSVLCKIGKPEKKKLFLLISNIIYVNYIKI